MKVGDLPYSLPIYRDTTGLLAELERDIQALRREQDEIRAWLDAFTARLRARQT